MEEAVSNGRMDIVKWIHQRSPTLLDTPVVHKAIESGHIAVLQYQ